MKLPIHFYKPLAIGAPQPMRELPVRPERMIHFFPPHIEKIRAKAPETARQCDVMCGNLEDAIPIESKEAARAGFIDLLSKHDFGDTGVWVRVNALNSPWAVSYTHLDVYKRQVYRGDRAQHCRRGVPAADLAACRREQARKRTST